MVSAPLTLSFEDNPLALDICKTFGVDIEDGLNLMNNKMKRATVNETYVWFFLCLTMYPFCSSDSPSGKSAIGSCRRLDSKISLDE